MKRWYWLALFALLAACSTGSHSAIPSTPAGVLGPRLNLRITHLGHPHYFYDRAGFKAREGARPHLAPYYGQLLYATGAYTAGPVQTAPVTHLIFWGWSGSSDATADPDSMAPYMVNFFGAIPGSSWLNTVTQYYQNLGSQLFITNPASQYGGATYDPSAVPNPFTQSDAANEAVKIAGTIGYSANANYIVVTPHGYNTQCFNGYSCNPKSGFCAYHGSASTGSGPLSYTVFPYVPDAGYACGANSVNILSGTLDGVSIVGGHEEAETITDPQPPGSSGSPGGWIDASGYEIGDKCAWYQLQSTTFSGGSFPTQPLWSNASSSCVQSYGSGPTPAPSTSPSTSPSPSPPPGTNVVKNPGFETGKLKPWNSCRSNNSLPAAFVVKGKAHSGKYDAYAGTVANEKEPDGIVSVCQLVTIPAGGQLIFWARGISDDKRNGVYQFARLYNTSGTLAATIFKFNSNDSAWVQRTADLSAYANGQYLLAFGIQGKADAHGRYIGLFVDDVSLAP